MGRKIVSKMAKNGKKSVFYRTGMRRMYVQIVSHGAANPRRRRRTAATYWWRKAATCYWWSKENGKFLVGETSSKSWGHVGLRSRFRSSRDPVYVCPCVRCWTRSVSCRSHPARHMCEESGVPCNRLIRPGRHGLLTAVDREDNMKNMGFVICLSGTRSLGHLGSTDNRFPNHDLLKTSRQEMSIPDMV